MKVRGETLGPLHTRKCARLLRTVFSTAVLDGLIARNPVQPTSRLSMPKEDQPKIVLLTVAQVAVLAAAPPYVRAMVIAQAGLGLRLQELLSLRVGDVDFLRRTVHVACQLNRRRQRVPLKTAHSRRTVLLPQVVADALAAHIRSFPPAEDGSLFYARRQGDPSQPGALWTQPSYWRVFSKAVSRAGLPKGTSSHDLRHHYASLLLHSGESMHAVADRLGDTPTMILSVYGHVMPETKDSARRAIDAAWAAEPAMPHANDLSDG